MNAVPEETYCLLVPLAEERLLVPRACVTEVINYQAPAPMEGGPPWYLGHDWHGAAAGFRWCPSRRPADARRRAPADARASS